MKSQYLIELPNGSAVRLRGGLHKSLERYGLDPANLRISRMQRIFYVVAAMVGPIKNRITRQDWRIAVEIAFGEKKFNIDVTNVSGGFVADCFVRVFGPDRFGLLYESMNHVTGKGEILYRLYSVDQNGVRVCFEKILLSDPQRHYSYPAFFEVNESGFSFTVESTDVRHLEIYRAEFNGQLHASSRLPGEYIDPNLVALPDGKNWLLLYSTKARPDELVIQPMDRTNDNFEMLGKPITLLNAWLARGGGDVFIAACEDEGLTITRFAQLSLPVYGSHLSRSEIKIMRDENGWQAKLQTLDRKFGASYRDKKRARGIHTFSCDCAFGLSVTSFDWR